MIIHYSDYDYNQLRWRKYERVQETAKKPTYINAALSFDIETSTFYDKTGEPRAFMYIWQFGIDGQAVYGRTWGEFLDFLARLSEALHRQEGETIVIYVHNLAFEFGFVAPHLDITKVFARSPHHPIFFKTASGFEFRCSYFLTGKSLAKVSESTTTKKLVGDLDYRLMRHNKTPLTPTELAYCENDVVILNEYINREIKRCGDISKIPYTKTGYVRREVFNALSEWEEWKKYKQTLTHTYPTLKCFCLLNKAFAGGFTHANCAHVGLTLSNVASYDLASSYPAQMIKHKYPVKGLHRLGMIQDKNTFLKLVEKYACVFKISITGVKARGNHHTISRHKCEEIRNPIIDNGRVVSADVLTTFMTSPDWEIFEIFYTYDKIMIHDFYYGEWEYLPAPLINVIVDRYRKKCTLKNSDPVEYMQSKEFINSIYGMTVQSPLDDTIYYNNGEWVSETPDAKMQLTQNCKSKRYCLPYAVGVFVTAWARYELLTTLSKIGDDAIYCDTDSIKLKNHEQYRELFDSYNRENNEAVRVALTQHGIDPGLIPADKPIGIFEFEGVYDNFKTLGAKRYCFDKEGKFDYTVAGLPKSHGERKNAREYMRLLATERGQTVFDVFDFDLHIPPEYTNKLGTVYNLQPWRAFVTDYRGERAEVSEAFGVALEPLPFTLSVAGEFLAFLNGEDAEPGKVLPHLGGKRKELKITPLD